MPTSLQRNFARPVADLPNLGDKRGLRTKGERNLRIAVFAAPTALWLFCLGAALHGMGAF